MAAKQQRFFCTGMTLDPTRLSGHKRPEQASEESLEQASKESPALCPHCQEYYKETYCPYCGYASNDHRSPLYAIKKEARMIILRARETRKTIKILLYYIGGFLPILMFSALLLNIFSERNIIGMVLFRLLVVASISFLLITLFFWSLLNKSQQSVLSVSKETYAEKIEDLTVRLKKAVGDFPSFLVSVGALFLFVVILVGIYTLSTISVTLLFFLSVLACFLLGDRVKRGVGEANICEIGDLFVEEFFASCLAILPLKVRTGDTHNITVGFQPPKPPATSDEGDDPSHNDGDTNSDLLASNQGKALKSEERDFNLILQGLGVEVEGKRQISFHLSQDSSTNAADRMVVWSCRFPQPGTHTLRLIARKKGASPSQPPIFAHSHDVKVSSVLRESWQPILAAVLSILTAVASLMNSLAPVLP